MERLHIAFIVFAIIVVIGIIVMIVLRKRNDTMKKSIMASNPGAIVVTPKDESPIVQKPAIKSSEIIAQSEVAASKTVAAVGTFVPAMVDGRSLQLGENYFKRPLLVKTEIVVNTGYLAEFDVWGIGADTLGTVALSGPTKYKPKGVIRQINITSLANA